MENKLKKGKKGAEKYLSPWLFVILTIVAGGVFIMVYIFYAAPYDVRNVEANVLLNNVADCVSYAGRIDTSLISNGTSVFNKTGTDFLKDCHLNFDTTEWQEQQYSAEINFYKIDNLDNSVLDIKAGNLNWFAYCDINQKSQDTFFQSVEKLVYPSAGENNSFSNLPQCVKQSFYSLDDKNNQYIIKILTAVRKTEKNAKV